MTLMDGVMAAADASVTAQQREHPQPPSTEPASGHLQDGEEEHRFVTAVKDHLMSVRNELLMSESSGAPSPDSFQVFILSELCELVAAELFLTKAKRSPPSSGGAGSSIFGTLFSGGHTAPQCLEESLQRLLNPKNLLQALKRRDPSRRHQYKALIRELETEEDSSSDA
jgi:hypothetical protein